MKTFTTLKSVWETYFPNRGRREFENKPCPKCKMAIMIYEPSWVLYNGFWHCDLCGYKERPVLWDAEK